jgi:hypothetical protein
MKHIRKYKIFEAISDNKFYIFGSENSTDYDVIVDVDNIPQNVDEAHNICKFWNDKLSKILDDKPLNGCKVINNILLKN